MEKNIWSTRKLDVWIDGFDNNHFMLFSVMCFTADILTISSRKSSDTSYLGEPGPRLVSVSGVPTN